MQWYWKYSYNWRSLVGSFWVTFSWFGLRHSQKYSQFLKMFKLEHGVSAFHPWWNSCHHLPGTHKVEKSCDSDKMLRTSAYIYSIMIYMISMLTTNFILHVVFYESSNSFIDSFLFTKGNHYNNITNRKGVI